MVDTPTVHGAGAVSPTSDDGWGPSTPVQSRSYVPPVPDSTRTRSPSSPYSGADATREPSPEPTPDDPPSPKRTASLRRAQRVEPRPSKAERPEVRSDVPERGLPGWGALLVLLGIAGIGGVIDSVSGAQISGGFDIAIIVGSLAAILLVRRSDMFPVVIAPPIVYAAVSGLMLYIRSDGLHDRSQLFDTATNWLVYGFPAIAAATAVVLIIAGIRLIVRR